MSRAERDRLILHHMAEQQSRWVRPLGAVAMLLGSVLVGIIGFAAWHTVPAMLSSGEAASGIRFDGGPAERVVILAIFSLVGALGLAVILAGAVQLGTGRRYQPILRAVVWLAGLLFAAAISVRILL